MLTPKEKALINFKKANSLLARIINMMEEGQYCIDVMQQNLAVAGLLRAAHEMLLEGHFDTCFTKAMQTSSAKHKKEMIREILKVIKLSNK